MRRSLLVVAACACTCLPGCAVFLNQTVGKAPNQFLLYRWGSNVTEPQVRRADVSQEFCVRAGPREVNLWVGVVDTCRPCPRGTVLILHGILSASSRSPGNAMLKAAEQLADYGYRAVLVDLRGHGRSGGEFVTGGPLEAQEISSVIDALSVRQLLIGEVGVVSYSLGAGVALHLAAQDPRIASIVAVAAPLRVRESVPHFTWTACPISRHLFSNADFQRAIDRAADRYGEDPDAADTELAISRTQIPILLIHSTDDAVSPISTGQRLRAAANGNAELLSLVGPEGTHVRNGHSCLIRDESGEVKSLAVDWFQRTLGR